jgi:hypothetical protein
MTLPYRQPSPLAPRWATFSIGITSVVIGIGASLLWTYMLLFLIAGYFDFVMRSAPWLMKIWGTAVMSVALGCYALSIVLIILGIGAIRGRKSAVRLHAAWARLTAWAVLAAGIIVAMHGPAGEGTFLQGVKLAAGISLLGWIYPLLILRALKTPTMRDYLKPD